MYILTTIYSMYHEKLKLLLEITEKRVMFVVVVGLCDVLVSRVDRNVSSFEV